MKSSLFFLLMSLFILSACGAGSSPQIPVDELPDPKEYGLNISDLPEVGFSWQQTYNQTDIQEGYKWAYLAYQAYQPGNIGSELESGFAVNNDVVIYEVRMSSQQLPPPPEALGNIHNITWKNAAQPHRLGDKSAVWKTTLGDMFTPAWWLEFYLGYAYVRISLLGFPDQIAPSILYGLGDIVASRLPQSADALKTAGATPSTSLPNLIPTVIPQVSPTSGNP